MLNRRVRVGSYAGRQQGGPSLSTAATDDAIGAPKRKMKNAAGGDAAELTPADGPSPLHSGNCGFQPAN